MAFLLIAALTLQIAVRSQWATTEFREIDPSGLGTSAAQAVTVEIRRFYPEADVFGPEVVARAAASLGLKTPLTCLLDLSRAGQEAHASKIVCGEIVGVRRLRGRTEVAMRVLAYDVASGLLENGAVAKGEASGDQTVEAALRAAARGALKAMRSRKIPTARILDTRTRSASIDGGRRAGFRTGMMVTVTRGSILVTTCRVGKVDRDRAEVLYERVTRGVAPGDKVRAAVDLPVIWPEGSTER